MSNTEPLFVVECTKRTVRELCITYDTNYLVAFRYDPYQKGDERPPVFSDTPRQAFLFKHEAAAEVMAAMVCGAVRPFTDAEREYAERNPENES